MSTTRSRERLAALFAVGVILINYPLLHLFGTGKLVLGVPLLYLYLFGCWAVIIALSQLFSNVKAAQKK